MAQVKSCRFFILSFEDIYFNASMAQVKYKEGKLVQNTLTDFNASMAQVKWYPLERLGQYERYFNASMAQVK